MNEEKERLARVEEMEAWARLWWDFDAEDLNVSNPVRAGLIRSKRNVLEFCKEEAYLLPSRVVYRRLVLLDEMTVRMVFNAMDRESRDNLMAEAKASVKNHGGKLDAHKARIIHERYGIPRF